MDSLQLQMKVEESARQYYEAYESRCRLEIECPEYWDKKKLHDIQYAYEMHLRQIAYIKKIKREKTWYGKIIKYFNHNKKN